MKKGILAKIWGKLAPVRGKTNRSPENTDAGYFLDFRDGQESGTDYLYRIAKSPEIANLAYQLIDLGAGFSKAKEFILLANKGEGKLTDEAFKLLLHYHKNATNLNLSHRKKYKETMKLKKNVRRLNNLIRNAKIKALNKGSV